MKSHLMTGATLCIKNQKGLLKLNDKKLFHLGYHNKSNLHDCIRLFSELISPKLNIVDATTALEGTGPAFHPENQTKIRKMKILIGGKDMFEIDNACLKIMGISSEEATHIKFSEVNLSNESLPLIPADPPFQKPKKYIKYGNIFMYCSDWGCTGCQMAYSRIFRKISFNPNLLQKFHLLKELYPKIEFYIGKQNINKIKQNNHPKIFFGNCTKKTMEMYQNKIKDEKSSEMNELFFISGCSADHNKAISKLFDLLKNKKKEL